MAMNWLNSPLVTRVRLLMQPGTIPGWWKNMSKQERRLKIGYSVGLVACAAVVVSGLPQIARQAEAQREDASLRGEARNLSLAVRVAREAGLDVAQAAGWRSKEQGWRARVEEAVSQGPEQVVQLASQRSRDVRAVGAIETFTAAQYDQAEKEIAERRCLAEAIYYESRGENAVGQLAVAEVVMNRVADPRYPNSICGVVYQGSHLKTGCQFTFTCDGSLRHRPRGTAWHQASVTAMHTLLRLSRPLTGDATHYHTTEVAPVWRAGLIRTDNIGSHIFYRFPRGAEWSVARARLAEERAARGSARTGLAAGLAGDGSATPVADFDPGFVGDSTPAFDGSALETYSETAGAHATPASADVTANPAPAAMPVAARAPA